MKRYIYLVLALLGELDGDICVLHHPGVFEAGADDADCGRAEELLLDHADEEALLDGLNLVAEDMLAEGGDEGEVLQEGGILHDVF